MTEPTQITHHCELIRRLAAGLPVELDRLALPETLGAAEAARPLGFRFAWRDVPFIGDVARQGSAAVLTLTGHPGPLPFTAEATRRRRRALAVIGRAAESGGLDWRVLPDQEIVVSGAINLRRPATPGAILAGAVELVWRGERHLGLLLEVLGEADGVTSPAAA